MQIINSYSTGEEIANAISHGLGALLAVSAFTLLLSSALIQGDINKIIAFSVYGISLIALFLTSTLYHSLMNDKAKTLFKLLDHCAIYLLIAGTYTPLLLITLSGSLGMIMLITVWCLAALGIFFKLKFGHRYKKVSLATYLGMGLLAVTLIEPLQQKLASGGITLLALGGLIYCLGVIFYVKKRIPYNHAIWHLFVLGGACAHFFMIWNYVS